MNQYSLNLINYNLIYNINLPTKISDYDYDPSNPNRRFISLLLHELYFYDKITNIEILNLKFSSDECYKLKYGLFKIIKSNEENQNKRPLVLTIKDIYSNNMNTPSILSLFKMPNNMVQLSILNNINNSILLFNDFEVTEIIKLLSNEI